MGPWKEDTSTAEDRSRRKVKIVSMLLFSYYLLVTACPFILIKSPNDNLRFLAFIGALHLFVVIPFSFVLGLWTANRWARRAQDFIYYTISIFNGIGIVAIIMFETDSILFKQICYFALSSILLFLAGAGVVGLDHIARNRKKNKTHISK